ncbi:DUF2177 family protein [Anaerotalea alkaliphila]|uniref:DUF2177 family protein n=1 Tax=Anaerotalea alkaliphila TaxID=2662126 RepID=A0A7X5HUZ7_9FIRM|nr:DUF2177 family protein [Anaerotalea alkaliphila]NDL67120.1 DUF2177 family protein [Anaerotalea alkaliphila]
MAYVKMYLVAFVVFFAVDLVWLGLVAPGLYRKHLGYLLAPSPNWVAAMAFYLLYIAGLVFFVVHPAVEKQSIAYALLGGMFFGLVTYATYDLTNLATVRDWPLVITAVDMLWGTVLGGTVSLATYWILTRLGWA